MWTTTPCGEGDTKVISKGEYGTSDVVAKVTYQGVEEIERIIESETVLVEPVTEVQARGTLERPSWAPTGTFGWPTSGSITSDYGYRYIFGGSDFHGGIDIANKKGTNIYAGRRRCCHLRRLDEQLRLPHHHRPPEWLHHLLWSQLRAAGQRG